LLVLHVPVQHRRRADLARHRDQEDVMRISRAVWRKVQPLIEVVTVVRAAVIVARWFRR